MDLTMGALPVSLKVLRMLGGGGVKKEKRRVWLGHPSGGLGGFGGEGGVVGSGGGRHKASKILARGEVVNRRIWRRYKRKEGELSRRSSGEGRAGR